MTKDEGEKVCNEFGGQLADIKTAQDHQDLVEYYKTVHPDQPPAPVINGFVSTFLTRLANIRRRQIAWWTGGRFSVEDNGVTGGQWRWSDGSRIQFSNWHKHNQHDPDLEHCLALVDDGSLSWISLPCQGRKDGSLKLSPLCQTNPI